MAKTDNKNTVPTFLEFHEHDYFVEHFRKKTNWSMPRLHMHNTYELYFLVAGEVQYSIDRRLYNVNSGDLVIVPKNTSHRTLSHSETALERFLIYFSDSFISGFSSHLGDGAFEEFLKLGCIRLGKLQQDRIFRIFNKMLETQNHPDNYSKAEIYSLLCELIIIIMRHGHKVERTSYDTTEGKIIDAVEYIKTNFGQELTLSSVARNACMEATYFSKSFKKITGYKFHDFVLQTRLREAEKYLLNTPLSISQIAEECGFTSGNHFGDVFKKHLGLSPTQFQNLKKSETKQ